MSLDRFLDERDYGTVARCKKRAIGSYCGNKRKPFYPDELDAAWVIDILFPEPWRSRLKFIDEGELYAVVYLPEP